MKFLFCLLAFFNAEISFAAGYKIIKSNSGKSYHTGLLPEIQDNHFLGQTHVVLTDCQNLPESFDLRNLHVVPEIKDQGSCGSCWAFSKTASLESAVLASGAPFLSLSEQELVSCDKEEWGCGGGNLDSFNYQINHGQSLASNFPYLARNVKCKRKLKPSAQGVSFAYIGASDRSPTADELKCALYKTHTIPWITVSASNAWGNPPSSIQNEYTHCSHGQVNHAVGVIGWLPGKKPGTSAFIMRNSWGGAWADKGYMSLSLGCDSFGEEAAFIMTKSSSSCTIPDVKLPVELYATIGEKFYLSIKKEEGVEYLWFRNNVLQGSKHRLLAEEFEDSIYKVVARNACSRAESSVRIRVIPPSQEN